LYLLCKAIEGHRRSGDRCHCIWGRG